MGLIAVQIGQLSAGLAWCYLLALLASSVVRVWTARANLLDVLMAPIAFIAFDQAGFSVRWLIFPQGIEMMRADAIVIWIGLYALAVVGVAWFDRAFRYVRTRLDAFLAEQELIREFLAKPR